MAGFNDFLNVFFGSSQSQVTAYAILAAIIAICITIFLTKTDMGIGDKFLLVLFVLLTLVPGVFLILFEITCMVTGGSKDKRWWCWLYAWVIAVFVVIYCILVIIISFSSLFTYNNAMENVEINETKNKMTPEQSNDYAKAIIQTNEYKEQFQNNDLEQTLNSLMIDADEQEKKDKEAFYSNSTEVITTNTTNTNTNTNNINIKKPQISPFTGGYATYESFTNKDSENQEESVKEEPSKPTKKTAKETSIEKDEFSGSVSIEDKEEGFEDEKKVKEEKMTDKKKTETKEEVSEPVAVVEPFGNMNFGVKYSRY